MGVLRRMILSVCRGGLRAARWTLSDVDDPPRSNVVPLPGPAHGPVPAIEVRLGAQRRRAS
jgi:hypothetical protein